MAGAARSSFIRLLRSHPIYARMFWVDVIAQFGEATLWVAYPLLVLQVTGDVTISGLALSGEVIAFGLTSPLAGQKADHWEPRRVLLWAAGVRIVLLLLLLLATSRASLGLFAAASLSLGAAGAFFVPAQAAFVRRLLEGEVLDEAVAASGTASFLIRLFAPAAMGSWLALFPVRSGVLLELVAYCVVVVLVAPRWVCAPVPDRAAVSSGWREGWKLVLGSPVLRPMLGVDLGLTFVGMASFVCCVALLEQGLGLPARYDGWIMAAGGLGGTLGTRWARRFSGGPWTFAGAAAALGLINLAVSGSHSLADLVGLWLLRGLTVGVLVVKIEQRMAREAPAAAMGRVQAVWNLVGCLAAFGGSMTTPWLLRHLGPAGSYRLFGLAQLGVALVCATCRGEGWE